MTCRDSVAGRWSLGIGRRAVAEFERCYTADRRAPVNRDAGGRTESTGVFRGINNKIIFLEGVTGVLSHRQDRI